MASRSQSSVWHAVAAAVLLTAVAGGAAADDATRRANASASLPAPGQVSPAAAPWFSIEVAIPPLSDEPSLFGCAPLAVGSAMTSKPLLPGSLRILPTQFGAVTPGISTPVSPGRSQQARTDQVRKRQTGVHPRVALAQERPIQGIDVSKYQGQIDWASVRSAGTRFAFIKATEGANLVDERFAENWQGARRAGVARGAYHFMFWCRPADEQAAWFRHNVPNDRDALPPVLDLEWNAQSRTCPRRLPRSEALAQIRVMLQEMEAHTGKRPIIYTDVTFHRDVLEGELPGYPHWVRSVAAEPHERYANRPWLMWQYSAAGRVPGIQTAVDLNTFYGGSAEWAKFLATSCDPRLAAQGACNG